MLNYDNVDSPSLFSFVLMDKDIWRFRRSCDRPPALSGGPCTRFRRLSPPQKMLSHWDVNPRVASDITPATPLGNTIKGAGTRDLSTFEF